MLVPGCSLWRSISRALDLWQVSHHVNHDDDDDNDDDDDDDNDDDDNDDNDNDANDDNDDDDNDDDNDYDDDDNDDDDGPPYAVKSPKDPAESNTDQSGVLLPNCRLT